MLVGVINTNERQKIMSFIVIDETIDHEKVVETCVYRRYEEGDSLPPPWDDSFHIVAESLLAARKSGEIGTDINAGVIVEQHDITEPALVDTETTPGLRTAEAAPSVGHLALVR